MIIFGSERKSFPAFLDFGTLNFGKLQIGTSMLSVFFVSLILLIALTFLVNKTKIGLAMKAVEQNAKAGSLMGINVNFIITFTFFLGSSSAAIAGALIGSYYQIIYPSMGFMVGLKAFAAAVLGGIGMLHGSVLGGLVVGVSECLAATFFGGTYRDIVAFVILILVLVIKPTGIFGKKGITKV
jgi:branched-chain amino acid transport system permease protein